MRSVRLLIDRSTGASARREASCYVVHDRLFGGVSLGLLSLLNERREICCLDDRPGLELHLLAILADDDVVLAPVVIKGGEVKPAVGAAALVAQQRGTRDRPGDEQHVAKVAAEMPAGVIGGRARRGNDRADTPVELVELIED